jgi:hypothetical protein
MMVMTLDFLYKKYIMTISVSRIINISCIKIRFRTVFYNKASHLVICRSTERGVSAGAHDK